MTFVDDLDLPHGYIELLSYDAYTRRVLVSGWLRRTHADLRRSFQLEISGYDVESWVDCICYERPDIARFGCAFLFAYDVDALGAVDWSLLQPRSAAIARDDVSVRGTAEITLLSPSDLKRKIIAFLGDGALDHHPLLAQALSEFGWEPADAAAAAGQSPSAPHERDGLLLSNDEPPVAMDRDGAELSDRDLALAEGVLDEDFYRTQLPQADLGAMSPAQHYLAVGWTMGFDPSPSFSTLGYLDQNEDVRLAGVNPLVHYLSQGKGEGRLPCPNSRKGGERRPPSVEDRSVPGWAEWHDYDDVRSRGYATLESQAPDTGAVDFAVSLLGIELTDFVEQTRLRRGDAAAAEQGDVKASIIIPCIDQQRLTAECIASIARALPKFEIEVIIADNGSVDPLYAVISRHPDLRYIRFEQNIGFGPACNAAAEIAIGEYVFFLNNDAQIAPGCLDALVAGLESPARDMRPGIVGPKILNMDGTLQEAGCRVRSDGVGLLTGYGKDPRTPRYNYIRAVEHLSGAAIMLRRDLFEEVGGFDSVYAPAYCEDVDLTFKIRARGLDAVYLPGATVAHHLSKTSDSLAQASLSNQTKQQRIARNRNTLVQRWSDALADHNLRTIAFFLPQYHPTPENDLWWGKGFTEWTNVTKAEPKFSGHNQPRYPADLGYYDLRVADVMEQQATLARRYGLSGFCYYYYWFDGHKILNGPVDRILETGKPTLPFCLCWANENWTRRWDGRDNDVLLGQTYRDEHAVGIAEDFVRHFRCEQYIRINGKPLVLVYRVKEIPNPRRFLSIWRNVCRTAGIGEICIAMVESFDLSAAPEDPRRYGCDLTVEFPAHGMVNDPPMEVDRLNPDWTGTAHDYRELALAFMRRVEPGFPRLRSVLVGWDSTPRHPNRSLVLQHATPGAFQAWLEWTYQRTLEQNHGDERIVFVNAWNEWCEGSYLEPDRRYGHGYLQALKNALESVGIQGAAFAA